MELPEAWARWLRPMRCSRDGRCAGRLSSRLISGVTRHLWPEVNTLSQADQKLAGFDGRRGFLEQLYHRTPCVCYNLGLNADAIVLPSISGRPESWRTLLKVAPSHGPEVCRYPSLQGSYSQVRCCMVDQHRCMGSWLPRGEASVCVRLLKTIRQFIQVLAAVTRERLRRFVKRRLVPNSFLYYLSPPLTHGHQVAMRLEAKLWGGFSRYALRDLEALKRSFSADPAGVSHAAWALACWYAVEGNIARAYENLITMHSVNASKEPSMAQVLLEADCLSARRQRDGSRPSVLACLTDIPTIRIYHLAMANTYAPLDGAADPPSDDLLLSWINRVFEKANLLPIAKADPARSLTIDNLAAVPHEPAASGDQPRVTVIVPVYKANDSQLRPTCTPRPELAKP